MKAIQVMFDSLNRHMLPVYGCDWVRAPNFQRLAERTVAFDRAFVGSMPCMPARRELHTGRYNFLHRSWGPLEPFDDSMPQILRERGTHTHLATDHYHYWEDGGCTYHTRYNTCELARGQEGEGWIADLTDKVRIPPGAMPESRTQGPHFRQDFVNRHYTPNEEDYPQAVTFRNGLRFLETNHAADNWFLHLETFDPHEPFRAPERFRALYPDDWKGPHFDWPPYDRVTESPEAVRHIRSLNAALISMCDHYLGTVLDAMDAHDLWKDTLLIVNTDHGFLLGEHDCWAKVWMPFYNEVSWMPLFVWDPRTGIRGERRRSLVQTIDLAPTLLDYFGAPIPPDMQGRPLRPVIERDEPIREAGLFGLFGGHVNVTDGRYVYMRAPPEGAPNEPLNQYTLMPTHMRGFFKTGDLARAELSDPLPFTKGCRVLRIPGQKSWSRMQDFRTMLFDLDSDPKQEHPLTNPGVEARMTRLLVEAMRRSDAPAEQFQRLGL